MSVAHSTWPFWIGWELHVVSHLCPGSQSDRSTTTHRWLVIVAEGKEDLTKFILDLLSEARPLGISKGHRDIFYFCLFFFSFAKANHMTRTELQRTEKCISSTCPQRETEEAEREREREKNTCEFLYHSIQLILLGMSEYCEHKDSFLKFLK